jgi:hypothetical protein
LIKRFGESESEIAKTLSLFDTFTCLKIWKVLGRKKLRFWGSILANILITMKKQFQ